MNRKCQLYISVLAVSAAAVGIQAARQVAADSQWLLLTAFALVATAARFLTYRSNLFVQGFGGASILLALLLGGGPVAVLASGFSTFIHGLIKRAPWLRLLFNTSQFTLCAFAAGLLLQASGGRTGRGFSDPLPGLAAGGGYLVCNQLLMAGLFACLKGEPFLPTLKRLFDPASTRTYITTQILAVLAAFLLVQDLRWTVMVVVFVALLQLTFSQYYKMIEQTQTRNKELEAVLNAAPSAIALASAGGQIRMANRDFERLCRWPAGGARGRLLADVLPPDLLAGAPERPPAGEPLTVTLAETDGSARHLIWYSAPVRDEDGTLLGTVEVFTDITALQETQTRLTEMYQAMVRTLTAAIDARDPYTRGHSERVSRLATVLAQRLGLGKEDVNRIQYSALLHDIGKVGMDDAVLRKRGPLTPEERTIMMQHPTIGADVLRQAPALHDLIPGVRWHHEWLNGSGYPDGLAGGAIPLDARIISVADAFDAMTSPRPYRAALDPAEAIRRLQAGRGQQFDPEVVNVLIAAWQEGSIPVPADAEQARDPHPLLLDASRH